MAVPKAEANTESGKAALTLCQNELSRIQALARRWAKGLDTVTVEFDDLVQEGMITWFKIHRVYARRPKWERDRIFNRSFRNRFNSLLRKELNRIRSTHDVMARLDWAHPLLPRAQEEGWPELTHEPVDPSSKVEFGACYQQYLRGLETEHVRVLRLRVADDLNGVALAWELDVSPATVSRRLSAMRDWFDEVFDLAE